MLEEYVRDDRREERRNPVQEWKPRTALGRDVKDLKVTSIDQIFHENRRIEEPEIIDALIPDLKSEVIEIETVQRMTKDNRKMKKRVTTVVGDGRGCVGVGSGKDAEVKAAIDRSMIDAKGRIMPVILGCGSWQCGCGGRHSIPFTVRGSCSGVEVVLKPAPRGLGIVASKPVKKMLMLAGIKDVWSFSRGRRKSRYNTLVATYKALKSTNQMKNIKDVVMSYK